MTPTRLLPVLLLLWTSHAHAADLPADPTPVLPLSALALDVQLQARVEEGRLVVQEDLRWTLPVGRGVVHLADVTVPLLFPAIGAPPVVVDRGILPPSSQNLEVEAQGALQVQRQADSLLLRGDVYAGKPEALRVRFVLPFHDAEVRLGFSGHAAGQTRWAIAMVANPPVRLTLALDRPGRLSRFEEGRERLVGATLTQPLNTAEAMTLTVSDLPAPARQPGRTLAWLGVALALAGLARLVQLRLTASQESTP